MAGMLARFWDEIGRRAREGRRPDLDSTIVTIAVLMFVGLDMGFVAIALLWLSERRVEGDKTDARNRERPIKYR